MTTKKVIFSSLRILAIIILVFLFCYSAFQMRLQLVTDSTNADIIGAQTPSSTNVVINNDNGDVSSVTEIVTATKGLYSNYKDVVATITINNMVTNEPIVYTPDNQNEYLYKDITGNYNKNGTFFTAQDSCLGKTNVTTVFGHTMKSGKMFGKLKNYKNLSYLQSNPTFTMSDSDKEYKLKIVAVADVSANYTKNNWYYAQPNLTPEQFETFKREVRSRSYFVIPDEFNYEDKYVILSCCAYTFTDERLIVVARIIDEDTKIYTTTNKKNTLVVRACEYYEKYGKKQPTSEQISNALKQNYNN